MITNIIELRRLKQEKKMVSCRSVVCLETADLILEPTECHELALWRCGQSFLRVNKFLGFLNDQESLQGRCAFRNVSYLSFEFMIMKQMSLSGFLCLFEETEGPQLPG